MRPIVKQDNSHRIEQNPNYPSGEGNLFLMRAPRLTDDNRAFRCVGGGVDGDRTHWVASINSFNEDDPDRDCYNVYDGPSREAAIAALWDSRYMAWD